MIEKLVAAMVEPLVDSQVALEKRLDALARQPGPPGPQGPAGHDADPAEVDLDEVARLVKADPEFVRGLQGTHGVGIKALVQSDDLAELDIELTNGQTITVELPAGPQGQPGPVGQTGAGIEAKQHQPGAVYRAGDCVTAHMGQMFKALADTAAAPGASADWTRLGHGGFRWRGLRPDDSTLKTGDLYVDGGSLFLCVADGEPGKLAVQKGAPGKDGRDGKDADPKLPALVAKQAQQLEDQAVELTVCKEQLAEHQQALADAFKRMAWLEDRLNRLED